MSPEVLQGKDVDEKSDVYSYGLVLWVLWVAARLMIVDAPNPERV